MNKVSISLSRNDWGEVIDGLEARRASWEVTEWRSRLCHSALGSVREIERIRARLIEAEQSGFTALTRDQIRAEIREEMRRNGELQD